MSDKLLTTKEVEQLIRLNRVTIYRLIREESFPAVKIGNQWRFPRQQVEGWLNAHELDTKVLEKPEQSATVPEHLFANVEVMALLEAFARSLNLSVFVLDRDGKLLTDCLQERHPFCEYVRQNGQSCLAQEAHLHHSNVEFDRLHILKCNAGLNYLQIPIFFEDATIALLLMGPIVMNSDDDRQLQASLQSFADHRQHDHKILLQHYRTVQTFSIEQIHTLAHLLGEVMNTMLTAVNRRMQAVEQLDRIAELVADSQQNWE